MSETNRFYFADVLRVIVVLCLIPFHASITYTGHGDVFVYDSAVKAHYLDRSITPAISSVPLELFVDFLDNVFMRLLFLVSGLATWFSLERRSVGLFLGERANKLMLPLAAGTLLVVPIMSYIRNINLFGFVGSFFDFLPHFFNAPRGSVPGGNFEWGHLWFLIYLFVFSLLALPLFLILKKEKLKNMLAGISNAGFLFFPLVIMLLLECLFRPGWPGTLNLYNDWANFSTYFLFYISGFLLAATPCLMEKLKRYTVPFLVAGLVFFILKLVIWNMFSFYYGYNLLTILATSFKTLAGYFLVAGIIGLSARLCNRLPPAFHYLSDASFAVYIFHYLPVTLIGWLLITVPINFYFKFILTVIISFPVTFAFYEIVRRIPGLHFLFGLKRPSRKNQSPQTN